MTENGITYMEEEDGIEDITGGGCRWRTSIEIGWRGMHTSRWDWTWWCCRIVGIFVWIKLYWSESSSLSMLKAWSVDVEARLLTAEALSSVTAAPVSTDDVLFGVALALFWSTFAEVSSRCKYKRTYTITFYTTGLLNPKLLPFLSLVVSSLVSFVSLVVLLSLLQNRHVTSNNPEPCWCTRCITWSSNFNGSIFYMYKISV